MSQVAKSTERNSDKILPSCRIFVKLELIRSLYWKFDDLYINFADPQLMRWSVSRTWQMYCIIFRSKSNRRAVLLCSDGQWSSCFATDEVTAIYTKNHIHATPIWSVWLGSRINLMFSQIIKNFINNICLVDLKCTLQLRSISSERYSVLFRSCSQGIGISGLK